MKEYQLCSAHLRQYILRHDFVCFSYMQMDNKTRKGCSLKYGCSPTKVVSLRCLPALVGGTGRLVSRVRCCDLSIIPRREDIDTHRDTCRYRSRPFESGWALLEHLSNTPRRPQRVTSSSTTKRLMNVQLTTQQRRSRSRSSRLRVDSPDRAHRRRTRKQHK